MHLIVDSNGMQDTDFGTVRIAFYQESPHSVLLMLFPP